MGSPLTKCCSLFPVHTNHWIAAIGWMRKIFSGIWFVVGIGKISDPYQRIRINWNVFFDDEIRPWLVRIGTFCGFSDVKNFGMKNQLTGIKFLSPVNTIVRSNN